MLNVTGLHVAIGGSRILRGIDLEVPHGKVVCLIGRNGVGKTTALKAIVGLLPVDAGAIFFSGKEITTRPPEVRARAGIGYVPQGREIFPHLTVEENLQLGALANRSRQASNRERAFALFPMLAEFRGRKGGTLSGGQQQQLAIARALMSDPSLLILDEPTEGIQPNIIDLIGETIASLRQQRTMGILLVEQYLDFARELADFFYIMDRGMIVQRGNVAELSDEAVRAHLTV